MNMMQSVQSVLSQYVGFTGRARRSEYWWWYLAVVIAALVAVGIDTALDSYPVTFMVVYFVILLPTIAVSARRLHDTDRSAWWLLLGLVPLGGVVLLVFFCLDGTAGPNRFGEDPNQRMPQPA